MAINSCRRHVLENMKLPGSSLLFGLPVVLDTTRQDLLPGKKVALTFQGKPLAVMEIDSRYMHVETMHCLDCWIFA